ncbi:hypothetical protein ACWCXB_04540 [Streptomyces sp. NPDC001514]
MEKEACRPTKEAAMKLREAAERIEEATGLRVQIVVIDPRHGTWALHTHPEEGRYADVRPGKYGEDIPLPEPLSLTLATDRLPVNGPRRQVRPPPEPLRPPLD